MSHASACLTCAPPYAASLLGSQSAFPLYVTATALAKLADPQGEVAITKACAAEGVM